MKTIATALLVVTVVILASCATTRGTLFEQVLKSTSQSNGSSSSSPNAQSNGSSSSSPSAPSNASSSGSSSVSVQPSSTKPEQTGLDVQTVPSDAQVYLSDTFIGDTPLIYTNFSAGTYKITISKRGYYDNVRWVYLDPTAYTLIQTDLAPKVGYISVTATPSTAEITIDGNPMQSTVQQVAVGSHTVQATAFGYDDRSETVDVHENQTIDLHLNLTKAMFRIFNLTTSRPILNPLNPGLLGDVVVSFEVSTYGAGNLRVTNGSGATVYERGLPQFVERRQSVRWNGRSANGTLLPDGTYRITISGTGKVDTATSRQTAVVKIDHGAFIGFRSLLSGVSGLLYAGTPEVLPQSSYSVSALLLAHAEAAGTLVPLQVTYRGGITKNIELDGQAAALLNSTNSTPISVGVAGKFALIRPRTRDGFSAALTVKATYVSLTASDILTNFTGLSLGAPFEYRLGPFGAILMPEIIAAPYPATYTAAPSTLTPSFWGYARGGIFLDFGSLVTGLSAALRTEPFNQGFALAQIPLAAGLEVHWLIPGTQLVLSGAVTGDYSPDPAVGLYGMAGVGIGFVN